MKLHSFKTGLYLKKKFSSLKTIKQAIIPQTHSRSLYTNQIFHHNESFQQRFIYFFLALTVALKSFGILTISSVDNHVIDRGVMIINEALHSGKKFSVFTVDDEDNIVSFSSRKRVAVDEAKKLSLESQKDKKHQTVSLAKLGSDKKWQLQANGSTEFQLYEDGRIGLKSDSQGLKTVLLHFEPII